MDWLIWGYRQVFFCKRKLCPRRIDDRKQVNIDDIPWLWVGVKYHDQGIDSVTEIVNKNISYDMVVTREWLSGITKADGIFEYIDAKTLEVKVFPSEGLIIKKCQ